MTRVKVITSHICLILTGSILLTGLLLLTGWLECCGPSEVPQPRVAAVTADAPTPTLAPPAEGGLRLRRGRYVGFGSRLAGEPGGYRPLATAMPT